MAFSPRAVLRPVFATATLAVFAAGYAGAGAAQDAGGYRGPLLSWVGKSPAPAAATAPAPVAAATDDDTGATYVVRRRSAPRIEADPERASPAPAVAEPAPAAYAAPSAPPPDPERSPPASAAEAESAPYAPPPSPPPAPQRAPLAPAAPAHAIAAASAPAQSAAAPSGAPRVGVHIYSVDRPYGMTPDPIAMPVKRPMVLVGPPDTPASQSHGADGDGDGKSKPHDDGQGAGGGDASDDN